MLLIDIVIVNYNSTSYLLECLESVYRHLGDIPASICVEDNASTDDVYQIKHRFPDVILSCNSKNIGFAAAANQGMKKGQSPFVMLLNPDSYVLEGFFQKILSFLESNPQVALVGPKILDEDGAVQGSARSFPTPLTALFGRSSLLTRIFPRNPISTANILTHTCDGIQPIDADWVSGACMVVRRSAIDKVGYFDERFFMYWEDADWCRRMRDSGLKVVYFPQAVVVHHVGGSSNHLIFRSRVEFHKSVYLLFEKYNPSAVFSLKVLVLSGLMMRFCLISVWYHISFYLASKNLCHRKDNEEKTASDRLVVLRVIARLNIGGPAIHVHLLTTGLNPARYKTILVTGVISHQEGDMSYLFPEDFSQMYLIPDLKRDVGIGADLRVMIQIFKLLRHFRPDIVHTHTAKAGFTARLTVILYNCIFGKNIKMVHTFHGHVFKGYFNRVISLLFVLIERFLATFTDAVIAISQTQKKDLVETYHIASAKKICVVPLGFNLKPFLSCGLLKGQFRKKLGVSPETLLIGIVGRLVPIKHHEMFLDAAALFLKSHPRYDVRFVIIGDGECKHRLELYCQERQLCRYVIFCGWIQNVASVYADMDALALTSLNEGTPVSIIEAMAASVPVMATQVGGVVDLMGLPEDDSSNAAYHICQRGVVCPSGDVNGFAEGLSFIIHENESRQRDRIERARNYVIQKYSQDRLVSDMESIYETLARN